MPLWLLGHPVQLQQPWPSLCPYLPVETKIQPLKQCKLRNKTSKLQQADDVLEILEISSLLGWCVMYFCMQRPIPAFKDTVASASTGKGEEHRCGMSACAVVNTDPHLHVAELLPVRLHLSCKRLHLQPSCLGAACGQLQLP